MNESFKRRLDKWLELVPDLPETGNPNRKAVDPNALESRIKKHGKEVSRQWDLIKRRVAAEEARIAVTDQ